MHKMLSNELRFRSSIYKKQKKSQVTNLSVTSRLATNVCRENVKWAKAHHPLRLAREVMLEARGGQGCGQQLSMLFREFSSTTGFQISRFSTVRFLQEPSIQMFPT